MATHSASGTRGSDSSEEPRARVDGGNTQNSSMLAHPIRVSLATLVSALVSGIIGTGLHRGGADINIPWGLVCALGLVGLSTWLARKRMGAMGVGLHLIACSAVVWWLASTLGPGGDILVPVGSPAFLTFFSKYVGYIWLFGSLAIQLLVLMFPKRFFTQSHSDSALHVHTGEEPHD